MFPEFVVKESDGLSLVQWDVSGNVIEHSHRLAHQAVKIIAFAPDGSKFAWCDGTKVNLIAMDTPDEVTNFDVPRAYALHFSPDGELLCTWEPYAVTKQNPQGMKNSRIWNVSTGECVQSVVQKKINNWNPVWLPDTNICCKLVGTSVLFYENHNFDNAINRLQAERLESFEVSPNSKQHRIACFLRGAKGAPSSVRIFEYPKFAADDALASKSFFKADSVTMLWNNRGTDLLLKTVVDVDTTGASYYGEQSLHYMSCTGDTAIIHVSKKGPIYDAAWSPNSTQFCVVFGFMPAKACIFDCKCQQLFEFDPSPKNECFYSPQGNLLVLAGFGNLRGNVEVWDCERRKQVSQFKSPDTTYFKWCSDGVHFLTATTSPRLRVGNGYKLWHYVDGVLHEVSSSGELYQVMWQPTPPGTFPVPVIKSAPSNVICKGASSEPAAYVPPHARGNAGYLAAMNRFKQDDDDLPPANERLSKTAQKNKKKRETKKRGGRADESSNWSSEQRDVVQMAKYLLNDPPANPADSSALDVTQKKIKTLKKKIQAIEKLKLQQSQGKQLEKNQIEKLNSESALLEELKSLELRT